MKIIDLTHTIKENMPVYPGTETPRFETANTHEKDGFKETKLSMYSHTGTHMDAPAHIFKHRTTLDAFGAEQFAGSGIVIECSDLGAGEKITMEKINACRDAADAAEFVLFYTGWDRYWGEEMYFGDYPHIDMEVAEYLTASGKKGVGLDVIGLDPVGSLALHKKLFEKHEIVIVENLTGLERLVGKKFIFCALPLKYENADGAPVRAVAMIEG